MRCSTISEVSDRLRNRNKPRRYEQRNGCFAHFNLMRPKNVSFLLSRHDVRRVHEKFSSRRFERADNC